MNDELVLSKIEKMIYFVRGHKVMTDYDLAELYGVDVKRLNEQVKRNLKRFPEDFMFECNASELADLRSQIATAKSLSVWNHKRRTNPYLFTENGVAMLSSVLNSEQAIQVNISIMRIFTKLRSFLLLEKGLKDKVEQLEKNTNKIFKIVFQRLDDYEEILIPKLPENRKKIGIKSRD